MNNMDNTTIGKAKGYDLALDLRQGPIPPVQRLPEDEPPKPDAPEKLFDRDRDVKKEGILAPIVTSVNAGLVLGIRSSSQKHGQNLVDFAPEEQDEEGNEEESGDEAMGGTSRPSKCTRADISGAKSEVDQDGDESMSDTSPPSKLTRIGILGDNPEEHQEVDQDKEGISQSSSQARTTIPGTKIDIDKFEAWMASNATTLHTPYSREEELKQRILELETALDLQRSVGDLKHSNLLARSTGREIQIMRLENQNGELKRFLERTVRRELENLCGVVRRASQQVIDVGRELSKFSEPDMERMFGQAQMILGGAMNGIGDAKMKINGENVNSAMRMYINRKKRDPKKKKKGKGSKTGMMRG